MITELLSLSTLNVALLCLILFVLLFAIGAGYTCGVWLVGKILR